MQLFVSDFLIFECAWLVCVYGFVHVCEYGPKCATVLVWRSEEKPWVSLHASTLFETGFLCCCLLQRPG